MIPNYSAAPPPPKPGVDLDDLFGGPSVPARPSVSVHSAHDGAAPPPPSYDTLNGAVAALTAGGGSGSYASPYPPPNGAPQNYPPPQQQQQQQQYQPQHASYLQQPSGAYQGYPPPQQQPGYNPSMAGSHSSASGYALPASPLQQPQPVYHPPQQNIAYAGGYASPQPGMGPGINGGSAPPQPQQLPSANTHSGTFNPSAAAAVPAEDVEDERQQLERIIRLRRELEQEQEREQQKKAELQSWGCDVCTFRNKLTDVTCGMCGTTRPGYTAPVKPVSNNNVAASQPPPPQRQQQQHPPAVPVARAGATAWQCGMCLAPNDAQAERCKVCYAYRSNGTPVNAGTVTDSGTGVEPSAPFTTKWRCSVCGEVNPPSKTNCVVCHGFQRNGTPISGPAGAVSSVVAAAASRGGADPPLPTTWACSVCTFENAVTVKVCTACESGQRPRHLAPRQDRSNAPRSSGHGGEGDERRRDKTDSTVGAVAKTKEWPCPTCTFLNPVGRKKCDMCATARPEKFASAANTAEARAEAQLEAQDEEEEGGWQDDDAVTECNMCHAKFTFLNRRHHCRSCGLVFCASCSSYVLVLPGKVFLERVCVNCYKERQMVDAKKAQKLKRPGK